MLQAVLQSDSAAARAVQVRVEETEHVALMGCHRVSHMPP